jgi:uncharacterized repeat protein (TIGR01451 family)
MRPTIGRRTGAVGASFAALLFGAVPTTQAAGTRAGTVVANVAEVSFSIGGRTERAITPPATFQVAELLQVVVAAVTPVVAVAAAPARAVSTFRVTNTGNGTERIRLAYAPPSGGGDFVPVPSAPAFYLDADGSGAFGAGDAPYVAGANDPDLEPDGSALLFAVFDVPAGVTDPARGRIGVTARVLTAGDGRIVAQGTAAAHGPDAAPGAVIAGAGDGGVDAIVGLDGPESTAQADVVVSGYGIDVVKTARVGDGAAGVRPAPGERITYELQVRVTGTGVARGLVFRDAIPAATTYVPDSLQVDDVPVPDAAGFRGADAPRIELPLGDVPAGATRRVRFAVTID